MEEENLSAEKYRNHIIACSEDLVDNIVGDVNDIGDMFAAAIEKVKPEELPMVLDDIHDVMDMMDPALIKLNSKSEKLMKKYRIEEY